MGIVKDLSGQRFNSWRVVARGKRKNYWICMCWGCGRFKSVFRSNLLTGKSKSCGCIIEHGYSTSKGKFYREYRSWVGMKHRCYGRKSSDYENYGARGISVCERWRASFYNFLRDMGPKPTPKHTIDRIDVNGNYCPSNCRWITMAEQAANKRTSRKNKYSND